MVAHLFKKFLAFNEIRRFVTIFPGAGTGSYPEPDQSSSHRQILFMKIHPNIVHPSTSRSHKWLFPSVFPTKMLCAFIIINTRAEYPFV